MAGIILTNEEHLQDMLQSPEAWISLGLQDFICISGREYANVRLVEETVVQLSIAVGVQRLF